MMKPKGSVEGSGLCLDETMVSSGCDVEGHNNLEGEVRWLIMGLGLMAMGSQP